MNKVIIKSFLTIIVTVLALAPALAQGGPGFAGGVDDGCQVPLDGGLSLLAAAGLGYGIKKYKSNKAKA